MGLGSLGLGVLALLALGLSRSGKAPSAVPKGARVTLPAGNVEVSRTNTGGGSAWRDARLAALAAEGITDEVAKAIVAMWGLETANGAAEWNYNVGNAIATPAQGAPAYALDSHDGNYWYRAYPSLAAGVRAFLSLLRSSRYAAAWGALQVSPLDDRWVRLLGLAGYYRDRPGTSDEDNYVRAWHARLSQLFPEVQA
jgi:hypothetical protein